MVAVAALAEMLYCKTVKFARAGVAVVIIMSVIRRAGGYPTRLEETFTWLMDRFNSRLAW